MTERLSAVDPREAGNAADMDRHVVPVTFCILTYRRPELLDAALCSVEANQVQPAEILVSDDDGGLSGRAVAEAHPAVRYVAGPGRGIGANRAHCVSLATQPYVAFFDDDATAPADYFSTIRTILAELPSRTVATGWTMLHLPGGGQRVERPGGADFLGYITKPWGHGTSNMIASSATIYPRELFDAAQFDDLLHYGYEEIDISRQAERAGYAVVFREDFWFDHWPPRVDDGGYHNLVESARLYSTWKFYARVQRRPLTAAAYCGYAVTRHLLVGLLPGTDVPSVALAWRDVRAAAALARVRQPPRRLAPA